MTEPDVEESKDGVATAVDLAGKIVAFLASLLGLAGYVLLLGAAIVWMRLRMVDLPPNLSVSLAAREELIVIGAQAVAMWVALACVLGGLAAWIVTGDPDRRHFDLGDGALALTVTLAIVFARAPGSAELLVLLPLSAVAIVASGALSFWPSNEAVSAVVVPIGVAVALGVTLDFLDAGNQVATAAGATFIFGALVLLAPSLRERRARQEANRAALTLLRDGAGPQGTAPPEIIAALERHPPASERSTAILWIERGGIAFAVLLVLGVVSVTSQVDPDGDLNKALVSLSNGGCVSGTFVTRGKDQLVIADSTENDTAARIAVIPTKEVLEVQVYREQGSSLVPEPDCADNDQILVHPAKKPAAEPGKTTE